MNEVTQKTVCELLENSKKLFQLNKTIESAPIGIIVDDLDQIMFDLFEIKLEDHHCPDCFHEAIYSFYCGEIELDEFLEYIAELKAIVSEDRR